MISIIISSQSEAVLEKVKHSIHETIGIPYEIISIENSNGKMGICQAYNEGASKAAYDIFCFMHEDIAFETRDWGQKVVAYLKDKKIGLLGVAGGDTKGLPPSTWSSSVFQSEISIIQHFKNQDLPFVVFNKTGYPENKSTIKEVVCIDGVWMCTRRDVFDKYKFDGKTFKGFHGYDIDLSLQVQSEYRVCVVFDIIMHHYSEGTYSRTWMQSTIDMSEKWKNSLPISVRKLSKEQYITQHWSAMGVFLNKLNVLGYSFPARMKYLFKYSFNRFFHFRHFMHVFRLQLFKRHNDA
jgi:glycosyltransferase involved in cell wall biosynthesis